jgi:hypothetical protein
MNAVQKCRIAAGKNVVEKLRPRAGEKSKILSPFPPVPLLMIAQPVIAIRLNSRQLSHLVAGLEGVSVSARPRRISSNCCLWFALLPHIQRYC